MRLMITLSSSIDHHQPTTTYLENVSCGHRLDDVEVQHTENSLVDNGLVALAYDEQYQ